MSDVSITIKNFMNCASTWRLQLSSLLYGFRVMKLYELQTHCTPPAAKYGNSSGRIQFHYTLLQKLCLDPSVLYISGLPSFSHSVRQIAPLVCFLFQPVVLPKEHLNCQKFQKGKASLGNKIQSPAPLELKSILDLI